jgi:hypothetical protein
MAIRVLNSGFGTDDLLLNAETPIGDHPIAMDQLGARFFPRSGPVLFLLPIIALVAALFSNSIVFLDYVHVMTGGLWTGIDLFMGIFGRTVMMKISPPSRVEVAKRLTPTMLFLMPSIATVATTAGYVLAANLNVWDLSNMYIIATIIVVLLLLVQGFGVLLPNELRVFRELRRAKPDTGKIVRLSMRNLNVSGSQAIFQIVIIYIMAHLAF